MKRQKQILWRVQEVYSAWKCDGYGGRCYCRRCIYVHCDIPECRYPDSDPGNFRRHGLFLPYGYAWNRRKCTGFALWQFYYCSNQFSDHGTCDFYYVESYQPDHRKTEHVSRYGGRKAGTDNKKKCPFCYSEIDIRATRCPHCTSVLDEQE